MLTPTSFNPAWLIHRRLERGLSRRQLASAIPVTGMTVYNWERGKHKPLPAHLFALSAALAVPPTYFSLATPTEEKNVSSPQMSS